MEPEADSKEQNGTRDSQWSQKLPAGNSRAETASHGAPDGAGELPTGRQRESETAKIPMEAGPANQGLELEPENCQQGRDPQGE